MDQSEAVKPLLPGRLVSHHWIKKGKASRPAKQTGSLIFLQSLNGSQLGQMSKTRQKFDWKSCEIDWLYYACNSLTYFRYVAHTITGNGNDVNQLKFAWNNSWNHISWIYFWRVLAIGDHCVTEVGRFWRYLAKWRRRQLAFLLNILLLFGFGQQRTMAAWK